MLTTSFGLNGTLIAAATETGRLVFLKDGYTQALPDERTQNPIDQRIPRFRVSPPVELAPYKGSLSSLSTLPEGGNNKAYFATVGGTWQLELALPDGRKLDVLIPENYGARSASLYRMPLRLLEGEIPDYIRENAEQLEKYLPIRLFAANDSGIYRIDFRRRPIWMEDQSLQDVALTGLTRVFQSPTGTITSWKPSELRMLNYMNWRLDEVMWVPTVDPGAVIEFQPIYKVFDLNDAAKLSRVDFLHAVAPNRVVAGSEIGQVVLIDTAAGTIVEEIGFPGFAWLQSLSAHTVGGVTEIWAVNAGDKKLYRWKSDDIAPLFRAVSDFPATVTPLRVATVASPVPFALGRGMESDNGFLANIRFDGVDRSELHQILVLGSDGQIYGYTDKRDRIDLRPEQEWVSYPFD